jgi:hypothetical protein
MRSIVAAGEIPVERWNRIGVNLIRLTSCGRSPGGGTAYAEFIHYVDGCIGPFHRTATMHHREKALGT